MEPHALKPGNELGTYRIEAIERNDDACLLLLAHDPARHRAVALHVAHHAPGSISAMRFLERARRLSAVHHPHLLEIFEARTFDELPAAVGAAPHGPRLDHVLSRGPLEPDGATRLVRQLASAVDALETAGAEVPALTPERIWIDAGGAQLDGLEAGSALDLERTPSSSAALAGLLCVMVGAPPRELVEIVGRAQDGAYLSAGQLAAALAAVEGRARGCAPAGCAGRGCAGYGGSDRRACGGARLLISRSRVGAATAGPPGAELASSRPRVRRGGPAARRPRLRLGAGARRPAPLEGCEDNGLAGWLCVTARIGHWPRRGLHMGPRGVVAAAVVNDALHLTAPGARSTAFRPPSCRAAICGCRR